jgi:hypothetical protein
MNTQPKKSKKDKPIEILVTTVFTGKRSMEQAFYELIRRRIAVKPANTLALAPLAAYTEPVVIPGVHAPERGIMQ